MLQEMLVNNSVRVLQSLPHRCRLMLEELLEQEQWVREFKHTILWRWEKCMVENGVVDAAKDVGRSVHAPKKERHVNAKVNADVN
jgi:hypothetical protein